MTSDHLLDKQPDFQSSVFLSSISSPPIVLRAHYYLGGISFYHHLPLFASSRLFCYLFFTFFPFPSTLFSSLFFIFPSSHRCTLSSFRAFHLFFSRSSSPLLVYFFLSLFFPLSFHLLCTFCFLPFSLVTKFTYFTNFLLSLVSLPAVFQIFLICLFFVIACSHGFSFNFLSRFFSLLFSLFFYFCFLYYFPFSPFPQLL